MSGFQPTEQQLRVMASRGDQLLVAAGAGSGKTAVLVRRVLRYLEEERGKITRLLITTYTVAAAAELRQKIRAAIEDRLRAEPGNRHLERQSVLVDNAEIGTIHSLCLNLIMRHFDQLELDPRCRLLEEADGSAMLEEETEAFLEELYTREDPGVIHLIRCYAADRSDEDLKNILKQTVAFLEKTVQPEFFVRQAAAPYAATRLEDCFPAGAMQLFLAEPAANLLAEYDDLARFAQLHPVLGEYPALIAFLQEERLRVGGLLTAAGQGYAAVYRFLQQFKFDTLNAKACTRKEVDEATLKQLTTRRDSFKKAFKSLKDRFALTEDEQLRRIGAQREQIETCLRLAMELRARLEARRRKAGRITYEDMERLALRLLYDLNPETGEAAVSETALRLRSDYDEIIVDECQDINTIQDMIFSALSRDGKNLFMVGDIKQSIYRFRGAEPEVFQRRRAEAHPFAGTALAQPTLLELNVNFRSHPGVLAFCNAVFARVMSRELGGVPYGETERLRPGRTDAPDPEATRAALHWLEPAEEENGRPMDGTVQKARYIAGLIRARVAAGTARYGDFAVLLRTVKGKAGVLERELIRAGIPVTNQNQEQRFFDLFEVQSVLAYLMVLNNPYDDVAMVSLLYGDFFRFTVGELAALRVRKTPLFENLRAAAEGGGKPARAYQAIQRYRRMAGTLYAADLLERIYSESGILAAYAAEPGGAEKTANLELLAENARSFEQEGYRGLYAFVRHIRASGEGTVGGARLNAEGDSVRILSIHKSKGLEFPIVILGDAEKKMNERDGNAALLLDTRGGAAMEYCVPETYSAETSLPQEVLRGRILADSVSEELRILYVALTRAREQLIVPVLAPAEKMEAWVQEGAELEETVAPWLLRRAKGCYAHWLVLLLASSAEGAPLRAAFGIPPRLNAPPLHLEYQKAARGEAGGQAPAEEAPPAFDRAAFRARLDWVYPHLKAVGTPAKLSVSELKGMREEDPDAVPLLEERLKQQQPRFTSAFRPRGNEVGNALHQALQFSDFAALKEDPERELARLAREGFILERQRALIAPKKLRRFTQSACFARLTQADYYRKEERFLFPMPAETMLGGGAEGEVLVQGVLDCYAVTGETAEVLDYKTDRVHAPEELIARYRVQMELYAEALRRTRGLRVARLTIYSFSLEREIEIPCALCYNIG